jgi:uncharacterized protein YggE
MTQSIKNPLGLNVFGSALLRVAPDVASITLSVATTQKKPHAAFEETRTIAHAVRAFLAKSKVDDVQSSRIALSQEKEYDGGRWRFQGYTARVSFNVILDDLDRVEEIICGAIDAGVNEIDSVAFQTRQLKEHRVKARQQAVAAAQRKAEVYAQAAGVTLYRILHIEDVNPAQLSGYSEAHVVREPEIDEDGPVSAFDPGAITVGAAVILTYSLKEA